MEAGEECSSELIHGSPRSRKTKLLYSHTPDVMLIQLGDYVRERNVEGCVSRRKLKKETLGSDRASLALSLTSSLMEISQVLKNPFKRPHSCS